MMKTIGFIDYYLSEWHANNYPLWIKQICEKTDKKFCVKYAWAEKAVSPVDGRTTDEWCNAFGVEKCETIDELCEKSDYIFILAPSNPEKHLGYAERALKYKKNTYIDKTFAPDFDTAKKIFDIAAKHDTKFFSSSALRFATELDAVLNPVSVFIKGGGGNLPEYLVHQAEMVVKTLGIGAKSVCAERFDNNRVVCSVKYSDERFATMDYLPEYAFEIAWKSDDGKSEASVIRSDMFVYLLEAVLSFFESGVIPFDCAQTLEVMKIRETALKAAERPNTTIFL